MDSLMSLMGAVSFNLGSSHHSHFDLQVHHHGFGKKGYAVLLIALISLIAPSSFARIAPICQLTLQEEGFTFPDLRVLESASDTQATMSCLDGAEPSAEVVIENGTIGILKVKAVLDVSNAQDMSSLILILDDEDFDRLVKINKVCKNKVTVTLNSPHPVTFSLVKAHFQDRRILGRVKRKLEKIWILPVRYSQDLVQSEKP